MAEGPSGTRLGISEHGTRLSGVVVGVHLTTHATHTQPAPDRPADFDTLYRAEWTATVRLAYLLTGSAALAEDLAQEAFASLYRRFGSLDRPAAYLRTTLVNLGRSHHRRQARQLRILQRMSPAPAAELGALELLDAIDALPYRERAVVILRYYADLPEAEIADALGCRPATVRTAAARALRRLRKEMPR